MINRDNDNNDDNYDNNNDNNDWLMILRDYGYESYGDLC